MIVRILGDRQYEIPESAVATLTSLDVVVDSALAAGDEAAFQAALSKLVAAVHELGTVVDESSILPSDLVLPHEGASLSEVRDLLASEDADS